MFFIRLMLIIHSCFCVCADCDVVFSVQARCQTNGILH